MAGSPVSPSLLQSAKLSLGIKLLMRNGPTCFSVFHQTHSGHQNGWLDKLA
jgi:hypothetical protein